MDSVLGLKLLVLHTLQQQSGGKASRTQDRLECAINLQHCNTALAICKVHTQEPSNWEEGPVLSALWIPKPRVDSREENLLRPIPRHS